VRLEAGGLRDELAEGGVKELREAEPLVDVVIQGSGGLDDKCGVGGPFASFYLVDVAEAEAGAGGKAAEAEPAGLAG